MNPAYLVCNGKPSQVQSLAHSIPQEVWFPPEINSIKWNVDASVHISGSCSAIGGVLCNH